MSDSKYLSAEEREEMRNEEWRDSYIRCLLDHASYMDERVRELEEIYGKWR